MAKYLFNEVLCILDSPYSKHCVGYLLSRSVAKTKYFLFCGDMMMTSFLSPDCPKKMEKMEPMTSAVHREMFTCLGNLNFVTKCSTSVNHFQVTMNFFFPLVSSAQHVFSINLGGFINVSQCDFVRGTSHMFHCGDAATSWSLWFTFGDTNRISLRMWQKAGSKLLGKCRQNMARVFWQPERGTRGYRHSRFARFLWDPVLLEEMLLSSHLHLGL